MSKPHTPTDKDRKTVEVMASFGIPQDAIGKVVGCGVKALRAHYEEELARAAPMANSRVAASLFQNATERNNVTAQIFWLKCRAGWREKDAALPPAPIQEGFSLDALSYPQLLLLERILVQVRQPAADPVPASGPEGKGQKEALGLHSAGLVDGTPDD